MKYFISLIILVFFSECGSQDSETTNDLEKKPSHTVVYLDNYYSDFLKSIKNDTINCQVMYLDKVQKAIMADHFSNSEYPDLALEPFSPTICNTSVLSKAISDLVNHKMEIESIVSAVFSNCSKYLQNNRIVFYIFPITADSKEEILKMGGVSGLTIDRKQILLTIDFDAESWKEVLKYAIAHEYHHAYCMETGINDPEEWNLLTNLVLEGKADSFAHILYPNTRVPWVSSIDSTEKLKLWKRIKPLLNSDDPNLINEIMFGSSNYPTWGGYALGYDLVQSSFKQHPYILKTNWANLNAKKILDLSGYQGL